MFFCIIAQQAWRIKESLKVIFLMKWMDLLLQIAQERYIIGMRYILKNITLKVEAMQYKLMLRLTDDENPFFGPGPAQLFAMVKEYASLHRAAGEMKLSYSKALRIVRDVETAMGEPMLIRTRGGSDGGGSMLTDAAKALLARYRAFEAAMQQEGDRLFRETFGQETT